VFPRIAVYRRGLAALRGLAWSLPCPAAAPDAGRDTIRGPHWFQWPCTCCLLRGKVRALAAHCAGFLALLADRWNQWPKTLRTILLSRLGDSHVSAVDNPSVASHGRRASGCASWLARGFASMYADGYFQVRRQVGSLAERPKSRQLDRLGMPALPCDGKPIEG
jgi:hypothetical protein